MLFIPESGGLFNKREMTLFSGKDNATSIKVGKVTFLPPDTVVRKGESKYVWTVRPSSGLVSWAIIKTDQLIKRELPKGADTISPPGKHYSFATTVWGGVSNISAIFRNLFWIQNPVNPDLGVVAGLGGTSVAPALTGRISYINATDQLEQSQRIGDVAGAVFAKIGQVKAAVDTLTGSVMIGVRGLTLAGVAEATKAACVANVLGNVATAGYSGSFILSAIQSARSLRNALLFYNGLGADEYAFIMNKLNLSDSDFEKALSSIDFDANLTTEETAILTTDERERGSQLAREKFPFLSSEQKINVEKKYLHELARVKLCKEVNFKKVAGSAALEMIKTAGADTSKVVEFVRREVKKEKMKQALLLFATLIGIVSFIITTVYTGGAVLVAGYVLMLVMNVILTGFDTVDMVNSFKNLKSSSKKEIALQACMILLTVGSTALGAAFSGGGAVLIMLLLIGLSMASIQGYGVYRSLKVLKNPETDIPPRVIPEDRAQLLHGPSS